MSIIRSNFLADSCSVGSVAMALALLMHDVDAAEVLDRGVDGALHVLFLAHVADHGHALAARGLDSATAVCTVPGSLGCGSAVLASSTTLAPRLAAPSAIASPMPRLPPETTRVRSVNDWTWASWTSALLSTVPSC